MNAHLFMLKHGVTCIGRNIITEAIGDYPGGVAKVVAINPDPNAPEMVLEVEHPVWRTEEGSARICIEENESVEFYPERAMEVGA